MSSARIKNGLIRAAQCGVAGAAGTLCMRAIAGTSGNCLDEAVAISAVGGFITGFIENPDNKEYNGMLPLINAGLNRLGLHYKDNGMAARMANDTNNDVVLNMIAVTFGFIFIGGLDYVTKGNRTQMTMGNLFRNTAIGSIPVSLTVSLVLTVAGAIGAVRDFFKVDKHPTYYQN